jgi:2-polyprenyl-6-methoxyphenol hydroxylase-like FAD-dependent oxidoreductase
LVNSCRIGYGQALLLRQEFLESLARQLKGEGLIKTSCRVASLKEDEDQVTVTTTDGFSITADFVIGADGVRSRVRKFICESQTDPKLQSDDGEFEFE